MSIARSELQKIPYLQLDERGARQPVVLPFWDGACWRVWAAVADGTLIEMRAIDVIESEYVAAEAHHPDDLAFPFLDFMWQHLSWVEVSKPTKAIADDLKNLAAAFGKLEFFWLHRGELKGSLCRFVVTEIEYILTVSRSITDHLQEVMAALWKHTRLNGSIETPLPKLPTTMNAMVFDEKQGRERTAEELADVFKLPPPMVDFYRQRASSLKSLGTLRNGIVHKGQDAGPVFIVERGYGIQVGGELFRCADIWKPEHYCGANVVSLKPLLAHAVMSALDACSAATATYVSMIACPPPMMPGLRVFTRIHQSRALSRALGCASGQSAWWDGPENEFVSDVGVRATPNSDQPA